MKAMPWSLAYAEQRKNVTYRFPSQVVTYVFHSWFPQTLYVLLDNSDSEHVFLIKEVKGT